MVAIITSGGLGLDRSSAALLGANGLFGQATQGQGLENVYVNAATGNLIVSRTDQMLFGVGQDANLADTYNSQGGFGADQSAPGASGDNWQESAYRSVTGLSAAYGSPGSTVTRTDWDGSQVVYSWNATANAYVANTGEATGTNGAPKDQLTLDTSTGTWTWTDAATGATETYDNATGHILTAEDQNQQGLTFTYTSSGQIDRVTTQDGEYVQFTYAAGTDILSSLDTYAYKEGSLQESSSVGYTYQNGKLATVTVDLGSGSSYQIDYGYDTTTGYLNSITQSDGSSLTVNYESTPVNGRYRVQSVVQAVSSGVNRTTSFDYGASGSDKTTVTVSDPTGSATTALTYDNTPTSISFGQLTQVDQTLASGAVQTTAFTYDADGNVETKTAGGQVTTYQYDAYGDCTLEQDSLGDTVSRTFNHLANGTNQLLTETRYTAASASPGSAPTTGAETTYYVYDTNNRLAYVVSSQGDVTQYTYTSSGQLSSTLQPAANTYSLSDHSFSAVDGWFQSLSDLSSGERVDTTYDFRGNVATVTTYSKLVSGDLAAGGGAGDLTSVVSKIVYVYDQAGRLTSKLFTDLTNSGTAQTFVYDGLGRVIATTDPNLNTISSPPDDAAQSTTTTFADGSTQTDHYDQAGELIASQRYDATGALVASTQYAYDEQGNLRISTNVLSNESTYFLYDDAGRQTAQILSDGSLTESVYDASSDLILTIAYATKLTSTQLGELSSGGAPTSATLDTIFSSGRPNAQGDLRSYSIYDNAGRLIESIDPEGRVTQYGYDGASQLTSKITYANTLSPTTLAGFIGAPPTDTLPLPTPTANASADQNLSYDYDADGNLTAEVDNSTGAVTRYAYNGAGEQVYAIDPLGNVTQTAYDAGGRAIQVTRYADALNSSALTALGLQPTASAVASAVTPATASDQTTSTVYDQAGRVAFTIDAMQQVCAYTYDDARNLVNETHYGAPLTGITGYPSLSAMQGWAGANASAQNDRTTRYVYDADGRKAFSIDATNAVTGYTYDPLGHVLQETQYSAPYAASGDPQLTDMTNWVNGLNGQTVHANSLDDRTTRYAYDADGRLAFTIADDHNSGSQVLADVTGYLYDAAGHVTKTTQYSTPFSGTDTSYQGMETWLGTIPAANSANDEVSRSYYDATGRLAFSLVNAGVNASSQTYAYVTAYNYGADVSGRVLHSETRYAAPYVLSGDPTLQAVQTWVQGNASVSDETTSNTYDGLGRVTSSNNGAGQTNYSYQETSAGLVTTVTAPNNHVTQTTTDLAGRLVSSIVDPGGLNLKTTYAYDAFGNVVQETDPNANANAGASSSFYYDKDNRLWLELDAMGFATQTNYNEHGQVSSVTRFCNPTTEAAVLAGTAADPGYDQVTQYSYDQMGRLTVQVDPMGYATQTDYNALGDATQVTRFYDATTMAQVLAGTNPTNILDQTTGYQYDHQGRVASETQTITGTTVLNGSQLVTGATQVVTNTYGYDAFGNRTQVVQAAGASEQQVTNYIYDLENRQTGEWTSVYRNAGSQTAKALQSTQYDAFGNAVLTTDANGNQTYFWYDAANRKIAEVAISNAVITTDANGNHTYAYDNPSNRSATPSAPWNGPVGTLTTWGYDGNGNLTSKVVYATVVAPTAPGGAPPTPPVDVAGDLALATSTQPPPQGAAGAYRLTQYAYDNADRLVTTTQKTVQYGFLLGTSYQYGFTDIYVANKYDADGNIVGIKDAKGDWSHFYYDADDRKTAQVDQAGYLTVYKLDNQGAIIKETQYAAAITPPGNDPVAGHIVGPYTLPTTNYANGVYDRVTDFTYDSNGRKLTETRENVNDATVSANGALTTATQNSTITYTYDSLGDVLSETQATGDYTHYSYDSFGRQVHSSQTPYLDYGSGSNHVAVQVTPHTDTAYNALGQVTETLVGGDGTATAQSRSTTTVYGAGGRVVSVTDPTGFTTTYSYDSTGNKVAEQYGRLLSNGSTESDTINITYDSLNREISRQTAVLNGSPGATTDQYYDAYGEVIGQGSNTAGNIANAQEYAEYDNAGRVWLTNMSDGVSRAYAYDYNGNASVLLQTVGQTDLKGQANIGAIWALATETNSPVTVTVSLYDARNLLTDTIQPSSNQTSSSIHAVEVDTTNQGIQYFSGNVTPNSTAGYALYNNGYGSYPVGQGSSYAGSGGSITLGPVIANEQSFGGYNWYYQSYVWAYDSTYAFEIDPSNAALSGGGTCHVIGPSGGEVTSFQPGSGPITIWAQDSGWQASPDVGYAQYCQSVSGQYTIVQDEPWGGQRVVAYTYVGGQPTTTPVTHQLELQGISGAATSVRAFVRPWQSTQTFVEVGLGNDGSGHFDLNLDAAPFTGPNSGYELMYMAFDASGNIVDSADGYMSTDGNGTPSYSTNPNYIYGSGQSMLATSGGRTYLIVSGLPAGTAYANVRYGSSFQYGATLSNGGWGQAGLFALDVTGWGWQQFWIQPVNGSGQMVGNQYSYGQFQTPDANGNNAGWWWEMQMGTEGNRTFTLSPPAGATYQQFRYSTNGGASWSGWIVYNGGANQQVNLSGLTDFNDQVNGIYEYQTYTGSQLLSDTYGNFGLGYWGQSASVTSQAQSVDAKIQFNPNQFVAATTQDPVKTLKVYYRLPNASGAYTGAFSTTTVTVDGNGNFIWNIDSPNAGIRPAAGQPANNVQYYFDAYDANGHLIPPVTGDDHVRGYLTITSNYYTATNDYSIDWTVSPQVQSTYTVDRQQTWNAFGEVASEIDGRTSDGHGNNYTLAQRTTSYAYNTLGNLVTKTAPQVTSYNESGNAHSTSPTETYYYDISGRQVGEEDANGDLTTTLLLAGSGYDGQAADTVEEFQGLTDTGLNSQTGQENYTQAAITTQNGFDIFGDEREVTTASDTTDNEYDGDGNLIEVDHALRSDGVENGQRLIDHYAYDGLGERIKHTDNVYVDGAGNPTATETTDYDTAGRVTQTTDFAGLTTQYLYSWFSGSQFTTGRFGSSGGWTKETINSAGKTSTEQDDVFGHLVSEQDFGGHTYSYTYNYAGDLTNQTSSAGENITYSYFTNGYIASMTDNALGMVATYNYDNDGNRTLETYNSTDGTKHYENSTIYYDTLNRIVEIQDPAADITYKYDAVGNRREVKSVYTDGLQGTGDGINHTVATEDYWYKYDSMNRFVLTMGTMTGGVIDIGQTGTRIQYDSAGNRQNATYYNAGTGHDDTDAYTYTADGYLLDTTTTDDTTNTATPQDRTDDLLGRVTNYITSTSSRTAITYDGDNRIVSETDAASGVQTAVHNDYKLWNAATSSYAGLDQGVITHSSSTVGTSTTNTDYYYQWWDQAKQSKVAINPTDPGAGTGGGAGQGFSQIAYDVNGHIQSMTDVAGNRVIDYEDDATGQVLVSQEWDQGNLGPRQQNYFFNGKQVGDVSNNGQSPSQTDYAEELAATDPTSAGKGGFRYGKPVTSADFDQSYQPINSTYPGVAAQAYTVKTGDTLTSIAEAVWGDANLWYLIADANGLTLSTNLVAGQILTVPNKVANFHNTSATFMPYNPGEAIGDDLPTVAPMPDPPEDWENDPAFWEAGIAGMLGSAPYRQMMGLDGNAYAGLEGMQTWAMDDFNPDAHGSFDTPDFSTILQANALGIDLSMYPSGDALSGAVYAQQAANASGLNLSANLSFGYNNYVGQPFNGSVFNDQVSPIGGGHGEAGAGNSGGGFLGEFVFGNTEGGTISDNIEQSSNGSSPYGQGDYGGEGNSSAPPVASPDGRILYASDAPREYATQDRPDPNSQPVALDATETIQAPTGTVLDGVVVTATRTPHSFWGDLFSGHLDRLGGDLSYDFSGGRFFGIGGSSNAIATPNATPYSSITASQLHQIYPRAGNLVETYVVPLNSAMSNHGINTPYRQAAFLAQIGVESNQLQSTSENLNYSAKRLTQVWPNKFPTLEAAAPYAHNPEALGNLVYADKYGNGDQASGDGYAYRGGGLMQTTFRDNYQAAGYGDNPDLLRSPGPASDSAAYYWQSKGLNDISDAPLTRAQFDQITRVVNGPRMMGADARWIMYQNALGKIGQ